MRRSASIGVVLAAVALMAGCAGGEKVAGPPGAPQGQLPQASISVCVDYATLYAEVANLFVNGSPDQNAGLGKLNNLKHQLDVQDYTAAKAQAFNLVSFILLKYRQGALIATESDLITA
ncbi:MAG TPA: hypothetical protein VFU23_12935, partial [Gemmatimonadales bacterium]|nr:hypothetical protein [Gemmatimonadales bacterium]